MKEELDKVYSFITKLLHLLEIELHELENNPKKIKVTSKKNIADTLHKLMMLMQQVNKIQKEIKKEIDADTINKKDQKIIEQFLSRQKNYVDSAHK